MENIKITYILLFNQRRNNNGNYKILRTEIVYISKLIGYYYNSYKVKFIALIFYIEKERGCELMN